MPKREQIRVKYQPRETGWATLLAHVDGVQTVRLDNIPLAAGRNICDVYTLLPAKGDDPFPWLGKLLARTFRYKTIVHYPAAPANFKAICRAIRDLADNMPVEAEGWTPDTVAVASTRPLNAADISRKAGVKVTFHDAVCLPAVRSPKP